MAGKNLDPFVPIRTFVQTADTALSELDQWQQIGDEEVGLVAEMTQRNELSGGTPVVREFEEQWRKWIGTQYSITTLNGTSSLYSAFFGLGVGPGDEVICPVNTWICTISPAILLGARPVFCDIDADTLLLDPEDVRAKITDKTAGICAVHLWGNVCDMDALLAIGEEHEIPVLEDCSHAHGAKYKGKMCGSLGAVGCWSLQGSKPVSGGEGGVLATSDTDIFERACLVGQVNRMAGIDLVGAKYEEHQPLGLGMKFRAHPLGIGIAKVQLAKLDALNARRGSYVKDVEAGLHDIPGLCPVKLYEGVERAGYYGFPIRYNPEELNGLPCEAYCAALNELGLRASIAPYPNLHNLPLFAKGFDVFTRNRGPLCASEGYAGYKPGDFPKAEEAEKNTLFLPQLGDPVPEASKFVLNALRGVAEKSGELASKSD
jgi:perosamine synthetase